MKQKTLFSISAALTCLLVACQKEEVNNSNESSNVIQIPSVYLFVMMSRMHWSVPDMPWVPIFTRLRMH